jgi:glucosamine--fructose-6-phosphate aminotransferase (isomerizing)
MEKRGQYTRKEIQSQPDAWTSAFRILNEQRKVIMDSLADDQYIQIIFTGCGSTYYLSLAAAALFQELSGLTARAFPASELWFYSHSSYPASGKILLVAVSRSGETTETLRACEAFIKSGRGDLVTLSCYPDRELAQMGKLNLVFTSGAERSVAQTRAFSTLYLATVVLATLYSGHLDFYDSIERLPMIGEQMLNDSTASIAEFGKDQTLDRFYFLGSGPRYGLACELSLKMKEMSLSHSEPFHFHEFRHGPKSMVTTNTLVIGLISEVNQLQERAVLEDMCALGGRVLTIGEENCEVSFHSGINEALRNVLYLIAGQVLAFERSLAKGLNPDRPHNLDSVVKL